MTDFYRLTLSCLCVLSVVCVPGLYEETCGREEAGMPEVGHLLKRAQEGGGYRAVPDDQLIAAEKLFARMLQGERGRGLATEWDDLGFTLESAWLNGRNVLALMEKPELKLGRGFYLFPLQAQGSDLLMMPHSFYDLHTRSLGKYFFAEGNFMAAGWNTVHRNKGPGGKPLRADDPWQWDMADLPNTYFTALTKAFMHTQARGKLIQLHGFAQGKRKSRSARDSDLILGNGTSTPPRSLQRFGDCLKINIPYMVRLYPFETRDLGGMENISAGILSKNGHDGFVQMEMSLPLREYLLSSVQARASVLNCMKDAWQE